MKTNKFNKFRDVSDYEVVVGFRLVPTQEEIDKVNKKLPHLRICPHCHKPVIAKEFACGNCGEDNLKVISK